MNDPLQSIRRTVTARGDAVRWACLIEATAPKPGNVYPGRPFADLSYADFVSAAEIAAEILGQPHDRIARRVHQAVRQTVRATGTNVNLGALLLLGPLVAADEYLQSDSCESPSLADWSNALAHVLSQLGPSDGAEIFAAIRAASAGGLGEVDEMDVRQNDQPVDVVAAMIRARDRDRVARQYADGFSDLLYTVVPILWRSIRDCGDLLSGVVRGQWELLCGEPDSLIARKNGLQEAVEIQQIASASDPDDPAAVEQFDQYLRRDQHRYNPGTTADLIAAALFVILRTPAIATELSSGPLLTPDGPIPPPSEL